MSTAFDSPSPFARWGWLYVLVTLAVFVAAGVGLLLGRGVAWLNWACVIFGAQATAYFVASWLDELRRDEGHREFMRHHVGLLAEYRSGGAL